MGSLSQLLLLLLASRGHSTGGRSAIGKSGSTPLWDSARPDAQPKPLSNRLFNAGRPNGQTKKPLARAPAGTAAPAACHPPAAPGDPPACGTGDAGAGLWQTMGSSARPTWRPEACQLRAAGTTELRCALRGKRIAFLGDSLVRNLFHGVSSQAIRRCLCVIFRNVC